MIKKYFKKMRDKFNGWFNFVLAAGMGFFVVTSIVNIISNSKKIYEKSSKKGKSLNNIRLID